MDTSRYPPSSKINSSLANDVISIFEVPALAGTATSFPGSLILPPLLACLRGGKMRDPGNEVAGTDQKIVLIFRRMLVAVVYVCVFHIALLIL